MRRPAPHRVFPVIATLLLALAACTDRNPAGAPDVPRPELPPSGLSMMTCTVSVRAGTLACDGVAAAPGVSAAIIGGQGTYVRLASSGVSYDGTSTLRVDVTVENLTGQALGTADGVTPSDDGVRVFFQSGPVATAGTGPVAVANADGEAVFTGAAQKYFQYDGILPPGDTTAAKEWRFSMPSSVTAFTFGVYVAAPVRAEAGWISVTPLVPSLVLGDTMRLSGVVRNAAGGAVAGAAVAWASSDSSVVTVDAQGLAKGVGLGTATVTASGGGRTGSVVVGVYANSFYVFSTIGGFSIVGPSATADGADSIVFHLPLKSLEFPSELRVFVGDQTGFGDADCYASFQGEGSFRDAVFRCAVAIGDGALGGTWRVDSLVMRGNGGRRTVPHAALLAAGAPAHLYVDSPNEDRTAPTVNSLELSPAVVTAGGAPLDVTLAVTDSGVGIAEVRLNFSSGGNPNRGCLLRTPSYGGTIAQPVFRCQLAFPDSSFAGTLTLQSVWVQDENGNEVTLRTAALDSAGFPTRVQIASTRQDTLAPTLTAFSFSPATVAGNGADSVTVTLTATDPAEGSGVRFQDMEFEKVADPAQTRRCLLSTATRAITRTMTCRQAFGAGDAGEWRVRYIRAIDALNNSRVLFTAEVQAAGYPTQLTVTVP